MVANRSKVDIFVAKNTAQIAHLEQLHTLTKSCDELRSCVIRVLLED